MEWNALAKKWSNEMRVSKPPFTQLNCPSLEFLRAMAEACDNSAWCCLWYGMQSSRATGARWGVVFDPGTHEVQWAAQSTRICSPVFNPVCDGPSQASQVGQKCFENASQKGEFNNYLVGGNLCTAFAIGELGTEDDFENVLNHPRPFDGKGVYPPCVVDRIEELPSSSS